MRVCILHQIQSTCIALTNCIYNILRSDYCCLNIEKCVELLLLLGLYDYVQGMESYCVKAFAEALEISPYTLAENAGLNPIEQVTELRNLHATGHKYHGINVRKGVVTDMLEENVVQPLLVTTSAISLATECVKMILKIDDIVPTR